MTRIRKKGIAIVETRKGILVVSGNNKKIFGLPGGGADKGESRRRAASRELREETGLKTKSSKFFTVFLEILESSELSLLKRPISSLFKLVVSISLISFLK